ncbi:hypothetical protein HN51_023210 [Arachis hypogaea]
MLTKSVIPAACFKATEESHPTSSATAVAATKVQSSSFQASSLSIDSFKDRWWFSRGNQPRVHVV